MTHRVAVLTAVVVVAALSHATGAQQRPLSLALLIDVSASIDGRNLELPRDFSDDVASGLLPQLTPSDRFEVAAFGATTNFSGVLPGDQRARANTIRAAFRDRSVGLNGPSRIWDAVDEAIARLEQQPEPRAVIVMTDGYSSGNRVGVDALITRARAARVGVFVLGHGGWVAPSNFNHPEFDPRGLLEKLATETGGTLTLDRAGGPWSARKPAPLLKTILEQLRARAG